MSTTNSPAGRLALKTALITGGASGFGLGIVKKFRAEGARVLIADLNEELGMQVAKEEGVSFQRADVTKREDWVRLLERCLGDLEGLGGRLDVVVNNAGATYRNKPTLDVTDAEFDLVFNVNCRSIFHSVSVIVPYMRTNSIQGSFLSVSSTASLRPRGGLTWYCASKAAVTSATKAMAVEYAGDKIRFNAVAPVVGDTGMTHLFMGTEPSGELRKMWEAGIPLGRFSTPADVANAVCFLCSDEASFITGVQMEVDGGKCI